MRQYHLYQHCYHHDSQVHLAHLRQADPAQQLSVELSTLALDLF
jgi:hypothetical protein